MQEKIKRSPSGSPGGLFLYAHVTLELDKDAVGAGQK